MDASTDAPGPARDDDGFLEWIQQRLPALRRRAFLLSGAWDRADDLVQDTLLALYPKWRRVAGGENVDGYVVRVMVGKYVDSRRRPWHRERSVDAVPDRPDSGSLASFEAVEGADGPLMAALATLSPSHRAVLVLRHVDDLTVPQIAAVLNLPSGTVKSRLSRATEAVRAQLAGGASSAVMEERR
ncbi:MAG TPA: sigma-70 family RNA polymerase sigma factor [Actinomycetes bacterium]|nr:sigma-70 family RNA polymerase sigma factor [Actinomycetes bacterium]